MGNPIQGCRRECESDFECDANRACMNFRCQDPCGTCGTYADCNVRVRIEHTDLSRINHQIPFAYDYANDYFVDVEIFLFWFSEPSRNLLLPGQLLGRSVHPMLPRVHATRGVPRHPSLLQSQVCRPLHRRLRHWRRVPCREPQGHLLLPQGIHWTSIRSLPTLRQEYEQECNWNLPKDLLLTICDDILGDLCNPNPCGTDADCKPGTDRQGNDRPVCFCRTGYLGDPLVGCRRGQCIDHAVSQSKTQFCFWDV